MKIILFIGKCVIAMKNKEYNENISKRLHDYKQMENLQDVIMSSRELNEMIKLHQMTTWQSPYKPKMGSNELLYWLSLAENVSSYPLIVEETVKLASCKTDLAENKKSHRQFNNDYVFEYKQFSDILFNSFGVREDGHKNYASAGALYPVIPLLIVIDIKSLPFLKEPGVYIYDSSDHQLLLLTKFTIDKIKAYKDSLMMEEEDIPKLGIAYMVDISKSVTKYKRRGYRHALIEVGLMAQNFRNELWKYDNLGECCWSGFNDNMLAFNIGLSPRLAPILMMQWFGEVL